MASLVPDVAPLRGATRVARSATGRARPARPDGAAVRAVVFEWEREGDGVSAWRADLAPLAVRPGHARGWTPLARIDLHGLRAHQLPARLGAAIEDCVRRHATRVLVIHGKGLHSHDGRSALREVVLDTLTGALSAHVRALATPPERLGGTGALAVELVRTRPAK